MERRESWRDARIERIPTLVLNADFRPLSYFPLSLWPWQETIKAVVLSRVNIVAEYDQVVRSPSLQLRLPSVISLRDYVPPTPRPAFTRFNVFLRDRFTCRYCGEPGPAHQLTFDHVVPRSRGGRTTWENVVTACSRLQPPQGWPYIKGSQHVPARQCRAADELAIAGKWPELSAQLPPRELGRFPLLGFGAGALRFP